MKEKSRLDYRHYISWGILAGSLLLTWFCYRFPVSRMLQGFRDLGFSLRYYAVFLFTGERMAVTVTELPQFDLGDYLPWDASELLRKLREMWGMVFDGDCFVGYLERIADGLYDLTMVTLCVLPGVLVLLPAFKSYLIRPTEDYAGEERPSVARFRRVIERPAVAVIDWVRELVTFFRDCKYLYLFLLIWSVNLNLITLVLEFLAFYFYFVMSLDFLCLLGQLVKLLIDLVVMFSGAPFLFWLTLAGGLLDAWRRSVGFSRLDRFERKNRELIEELHLQHSYFILEMEQLSKPAEDEKKKPKA